MQRIRWARTSALAVLTATAMAVAGSPSSAAAQGRTNPLPVPGDWPHHHRDLGGTRYSPLDQIDASSVGRIGIEWEWRSDSLHQAPEYRNASTPILFDGTLYFTTGRDRAVVAVAAGTGETRWVWRLDEGARARVAPRANSGRGVAIWVAGSDARVFVVTPGFHLVALDARSGMPVAGFGNQGVVDLKLELGVPIASVTAAIGSSSPPLIFEDIVVIGPALEVGLRPRSRRNVPGRLLAIDARTGRLRWRFNTIPQPGEFGNETWQNDSWEYTGNTGAWAPHSLDAQRGWLYVPTEAATGDYYGGHRPGDNLFSTSLLCLDVRTGRRIWHRQIVRHDIWDYDNPSAPILVDIPVDGRHVEAVVQLTKQSFAYVFDRVTGEPVWPMPEQPVPASDLPAERASPTQPIPTKPAPYDRQGFSIDDLIDFTPALRAEAIEAIRPFRLGPLFTPGSLRDAPDGTRGTLSLPGNLGGGNWEGGAVDPETGVLYAGSTTSPTLIAMAHDSARSDMDYVMVGGRVPTVQGLPIVKPPYSRITAIDLNTGDHLWMVPNGETPPAIRDHPALQGLDVPPTGGTTRPVLLVTRTLLFAGEGYEGRPVLRAYDKRTGRVVHEFNLPGAVTAQPMTFLHQGRQYLAVWVGDARNTVRSRLIALALPR
ncbi:MAG: PQQ-binding-like beta-propeller repeat protein [Gemmatimonadetes bacterium]|nr:PQQ-binding-like beta-propeller repeat protein [Gemmatimonadota bacterium]